MIDANSEHSCVVNDKSVQSLNISTESKMIISTNEGILNLKDKDLFATSLKNQKKIIWWYRWSWKDEKSKNIRVKHNTSPSFDNLKKRYQ